jgi:hypothetical protein
MTEEKFEFRNENKSAYRTLKIPLKTILKDKKLQPKIEELVLLLNDLVIHSYQFIRLYVLDKFNKNKPIPEINETFILYCLKTLKTRDNRGRKAKDSSLVEDLELFYQTEYEPLFSHEKLELNNLSHILPYLATQIHTCISNNVQEHFVSHFRRFVNKTLTGGKKDLFQFKNKLLGTLDEIKEFSEWQKTHLPHIFPADIKKCVYYDLKVKPMEYLEGMLYMNSVLEKTESKLFQPLPLRTDIIPKHIILDTACIIEYFCPDIEIKKSTLLKNVKLHQKVVWDSFLKLNHKIFRNKYYQFSNQIQTDGISCSLLFIRKDLAERKRGDKIPVIPAQKFTNIEDLSETELNDLKTRNIVGCDPGKHSLVYMVDSTGKKLQYTASQRKFESNQKRNQIVMKKEKEKNKIQEEETDLSKQKGKTVDYEKFKTYITEKNKLNTSVKDFYNRATWRKAKFRSYSYGKQTIDNFLNRIESTFGKNIVIGYGNWSQTEQMKNYMPTLGVGLRRLIHKRFDTITINECYTSQNCCDCYSKLEHHNDINGKEIFRLLKCVSCKNKKIVFKTRDVNSAVNIRNLTRCWLETRTRPTEFSTFRLSPEKDKG